MLCRVSDIVSFCDENGIICDAMVVSVNKNGNVDLTTVDGHTLGERQNDVQYNESEYSIKRTWKPLQKEKTRPRNICIPQLLQQRIEHDFSYHDLNEMQLSIYKEIIDEVRALAIHLCSVTPQTREQSLAIADLDAFLSHAEQALSRYSQWYRE